MQYDHKHKQAKKVLKDVEYIIIDEISMVKEIHYQFFLLVKQMLPHVKIIISGDYLQLLPIQDRYIYGNYKDSLALHELVDGNRIELHTCRRANKELFNICKDVNNIDINQYGNKKCMINLCWTNKKRMKINKTCMPEFTINEGRRTKKRMQTVKLKALPWDGNSQDVEICKGMPVIARINYTSLDICNAETFKIHSVNEQEVIVRDEKRSIKINTNLFTRIFYVAFAMTIYKAQSITIDEPDTIYQWNKINDDRLKYVALSRATQKQYINFV